MKYMLQKKSKVTYNKLALDLKLHFKIEFLHLLE